MIKLYLFGPPRLERNGHPIEISLRKALALLTYLAVTKQAHSRDALATLFWPEKNQQTARANLRRTLFDLGQPLGDALLEVTPEMVRLRSEAGLWLDVDAFQRALAESMPLQSPTAPLERSAKTNLATAVDLYTNEFLAGFTLRDAPDFDDWQFFQREELRRAFANALQQMVQIFEGEASWEEALRYARRWLLLDPLDETVQRQVMQLYALAGQPAAALRQYEECMRILQTELDAPPDAETTALYEAIRTKRFPLSQQMARQPGDERAIAEPTVTQWRGAPALRSPNHPMAGTDRPAITQAPSHALPLQTTPFVGRQHELDEVVHRLADPACRLLTLVGPGGIGKTRLALAVAEQILDFGGRPPKFQDGVFFVPLQAVNAPASLVPAIADALGFQFYSGTTPKQQLLQYLQQKALLLVLDNFEHLLDGAELVAELLAGAPLVKIMVTSREALKLQEEWFHPLAGMRLPPPSSLPAVVLHADTAFDAQSMAAYDAVALFVQTARRAAVDFEPTAHEEEIVRICRLVDGMPLAIVLAASWLKVLSCAEIAQEIERGVDFLVTRHQNVPARHRSMRAVLEQSWQLLDDQSRRVLEQLAVFQGGFAQEAATIIAGANLLTLAELVDKAWVYRTPDGRYQQHELLRQSAADRFASDPATATAPRARHTAYYLQFVTQYEQALIGPEQRRALDAIGVEIDNVLAAWLHALEQGEFALVNAAQSALYLFFHTRSRYAEGQEQFVRAVQRLDQAGHGNGEWAGLRCRLLGCIGSFRLAQGEIDAADGDFAAVLENCSDPRLLAFVYYHVGNAARWRGDRPAAEAALQRSLELARTSGDDNYVAEALLGLSDVASSFSDFAKGQRFARQALALCRQLGRPNLTASVLASLAWATNCLGGYIESARYYRESLTIAESIGNPFGIGLATQFLGWVAYCEGGERLSEALAYYERSVAIFRQIGYGNHLAMALGDYALAATELGDYTAAHRSAQEGLAIAEKLGHHNMIAYNLNGLGGAACGLGDLASSRDHLLRSLQISITLQTYDHAVVTLYLIAGLLVDENEQTTVSPGERQDKAVQALEIYAVVAHQPVTWQLFRDRAQRAQIELANRLPADVCATALARGHSQTIEQIAAVFLLPA